VQVVQRLAAALGSLPPESVATPDAERLGAVLVLVEPHGDSDATLVYTRRRDDLRSHPGQISFPGGRVDAGETVEQAAVREAREEVALDPAGVRVVGRLPAFYIPPSRFWLQPIVAHWTEPHPLTPSEAEVATVLHVALSRLRDPQAWRAVRLSSTGWTWAWDLGDGHLLWGATAVVTTVLLGLLDPAWSNGVGPGDLRDREVRPWERDRRVTDRRLPPRLPGVPQTTEAHPALDPPALTPERVARAGAAVAEAGRLLAAPSARVLVLAGRGGTGAVGRATADALRAAGADVVLVTPNDPPATLPRDVDVVVDALVGRGLRGPLRGSVLELVHALRLQDKPLVAVDVPSGVHADEGLIGDALSADVTIAVGGVRPGLLLPGLAPFVGDLYVAGLDPSQPPLARVVGQPATGTWAE